MAKLEDVVRRLEEGQTTLEEAVALYQEGQQLARLAETMLGRAERLLTGPQDVEWLDEEAAGDGS
jgi:exodeoxyribonuclease VII small subunit